ncbi:MAG: acyl carrier protein [Candidatus Micrarchaeota archaeon]|nr:acyl carrier protein [Candidatus Micrarchaeota archaeon]
MEDVEKRLTAIVADVFKADPKKLKGSTRFIEDLGARSLTMIALIAAVEGEFGITTSPSENSKNKTISQAVAYIKKKIKEKK